MKPTAQPTPKMVDSARLDKPDLPYGSYTRIARRVRPQVTPQHVREVFLGRRRSPRIAAAIARYIESLERSAAA